MIETNESNNKIDKNIIKQNSVDQK